jgi:formylglycine-generating enzyme required for sulfatase activity
LQPEYGIIFLTTEPPDAALYLDGKLQSKNTGRLELEVRKHAFEVRAKGYIKEVRYVTPSKELSRQVDIRLKPVSTAGKPDNITTAKSVKSSQDMVLLQPATFKMGASRREAGRRANERLRQVRITRPYYLGVREVTNGEFKRFKPGHSSGAIGRNNLDGDKQPVVNVSRDEVIKYLNWLSERDGFKPFYREENGRMVPVNPMTNGYRLPFESEWAYGARYSGRRSPSRYPWSGTFPPPQKSGNFADESSRGLLSLVIAGYNDSFPVSAPVALFPKSLGGFFDIGGNVSEWCHDLYHPYTGFSQKEMVDPVGPETGTHHVVRGSSWRDGSITELRLSYRSYSNKGLDDLGFRVARFAK